MQRFWALMYILFITNACLAQDVSSKDPYQVLGVTQDSTTKEINSAWRRLVLRYHPDHHPENAKKYEQILIRINAARDAILNAQKSPSPFSTQEKAETFESFSQRNPNYNPESQAKSAFDTIRATGIYDLLPSGNLKEFVFYLNQNTTPAWSYSHFRLIDLITYIDLEIRTQPELNVRHHVENFLLQIFNHDYASIRSMEGRAESLEKIFFEFWIYLDTKPKSLTPSQKSTLLSTVLDYLKPITESEGFRYRYQKMRLDYDLAENPMEFKYAPSLRNRCLPFLMH